MTFESSLFTYVKRNNNKKMLFLIQFLCQVTVISITTPYSHYEVHTLMFLRQGNLGTLNKTINGV